MCNLLQYEWKLQVLENSFLLLTKSFEGKMFPGDHLNGSEDCIFPETNLFPFV